MFTIIISEKGGAERRESFDKNEINVGRVQGNDLMLPKGNVSKHHARLLYRDGRFIVTDLKSTNGTYVNGRKIAQATIVREGDKIYIGDFVLKLDTGGGASQNPPEPDYRQQQQDDSSGRTPARIQQPPTPPPIQPAPVHMAGPQMGGPQMGPPGGLPPMGMPMSPQMPAPMPPQMPPLPQPIVQQPPMQARATDQAGYPLDRDPDESESGPGAGKVPPAPRVPNVPPGARVGNSTAVLQQRPGGSSPQPPPAAQTAPPAPRPPSPASMPPRQMPRETPAQAGRRLALITLVDRVADVLDLSALKKTPTVDEATTKEIDRAVREQAKAMRDEGEAPEGIDLELLVRDALRELIGLGPIGPLLEDDEVSEIHAMRHDYVLALRGGNPVLADASFTSEEALNRTISRLAHQSGEPWQPGEVVVERRLARGAQMIGIAPPAASSCVLVVRKRRRVDMSMEELVRSGALSRPMATLLEACLAARANVLVCGGGSAVVASILAALASSGPPGDRIAVLQDSEELGIAQAYAVSLALPDHRARGEEAVRAAAALRAELAAVLVEARVAARGRAPGHRHRGGAREHRGVVRRRPRGGALGGRTSARAPHRGARRRRQGGDRVARPLRALVRRRRRGGLRGVGRGAALRERLRGARREDRPGLVQADGREELTPAVLTRGTAVPWRRTAVPARGAAVPTLRTAVLTRRTAVPAQRTVRDSRSSPRA
jgi:pilus assembly protein CpaF